MLFLIIVRTYHKIMVLNYFYCVFVNFVCNIICVMSTRLKFWCHLCPPRTLKNGSGILRVGKIFSCVLFYILFVIICV